VQQDQQVSREQRVHWVNQVPTVSPVLQDLTVPRGLPVWLVPRVRQGLQDLRVKQDPKVLSVK